ncbi:Tetracycline resistance protein [Neofusicoccum parvum]|uniref:Tetracycline resistance protein n=1 Tax=Neofusicoccum parvum TaxID=310453 RepID=A0ACB5RR69_9PEZI|nr:Tetracycline resistance protein [Neofusicoccum parvum]
MPSTTDPSPPTLPILIIGGGLGGLLLAQGLARASIPFLLFERDATPHTRPQGYRIRISGAGITALESTLPASLWTRFERTCAAVELGGGGVVDAHSGAVAADGLHPTGGPPPHMRAGRRPYTPDRATLRGVLMEGLGGRMRFGKEFAGYDVEAAADGSGVVTARFGDGTSARGCLLVGADGARSRVRRRFLGGRLRPVDTDGRVVYGKTLLTEELRARMPEGLLGAMMLVEDKSRGEGVPVTCLYEPIRFPQRAEVEGLPEDYVYWVLVSRRSTFGVADEELVEMTSERAGELALEVTEKWHPQLRPLFELQERSQTAALRVLSMRPELAAWAPLEEPVTLIGDAAHVMSPSGGMGAVTAFRDAANLARVLVENGGRVSAESVGQYEEMMREYAAEAIQGSRRGGVRFFNHPPFEECKPVNA